MAGRTVKRSEGETLTVLGMPLRFLCDAHDTAGAWSLMEEDIPIGHGPPPHRHDWDEAYYVITGAVDFEMDGKSVRIEAVTSPTSPGIRFTHSRAARRSQRAFSSSPRQLTRPLSSKM